MGGTGAPGGGSAISALTDSPLSGANAAMYTRADTCGWVPASVIDHTPVGVTDQDHGLEESLEDLPGRGDVAFQGERGVLHYRDVIAVGGEAVVDGLPA